MQWARVNSTALSLRLISFSRTPIRVVGNIDSRSSGTIDDHGRVGCFVPVDRENALPTPNWFSTVDQCDFGERGTPGEHSHDKSNITLACNFD